MRELELLQRIAADLPELQYVVNRSWVERVQNAIATSDAGTYPDDACYAFFHILTDHRLPFAVPCIAPEDLDRRLQAVASLARAQQKTSEYRKTRGELASRQNNQVLGALFEINVLDRLIHAAAGSIELFPAVGSGGQNVEARVNADGRWIYVEVKAIGSSKFDPRGRSGSGSVDSMVRQVKLALDSKLGPGSQLRAVSSSYPTVLCLSLGFLADRHSGAWALDEFLTEDTSQVSCIFLAESVYCNLGMRPFQNSQPFRLSPAEWELFRSALDVDLYYEARGIGAEES